MSKEGATSGSRPYPHAPRTPKCGTDDYAGMESDIFGSVGAARSGNSGSRGHAKLHDVFRSLVTGTVGLRNSRVALYRMDHMCVLRLTLCSWSIVCCDGGC